MGIQRFIGLTAVILGGCILVPVRASAELPEKLRGDIEKAKATYGEALTLADKKLIAGFDAETDLIRKQPGLKAEERQQQIEAIKTQKAAFETSGAVPFSSRMRAATLNHHKSIQEARRPVSAAYDRAIDDLTKAKDDAGAAMLVAEKNKVLEPKLVATWDCTSEKNRGGFTFKIYSDGSCSSQLTNATQVYKGSWTLEKDKLIFKLLPTPGSPPGGYIDTCIIDPSGLRLTATNQTGGKWKATWVDPAK